MLSHDRLKELLEYNRDTGLLIWKVNRRGKAKKGTIAGKKKKSGYIEVFIDSKRYSASRLIFFYETGAWPKNEMDHIDRNPSNNQWNNLREVSSSQNKFNQCRKVTKHKLLKWVKKTRSGKFAATVTIHSMKTHLGSFDSEHAAHEAAVQYLSQNIGAQYISRGK